MKRSKGWIWPCIPAFLLGTAACITAIDVDSEEQDIALATGTDYGYPQHNAVVRVEFPGGHCTGTLVAPNLVLTAGHCVDTLRFRPTAPFSHPFGWDEWEVPGAWYPIQTITIRVGRNSTGGTTFVANEYSLPGGNDAFLLRLGSSVPSWLAEPTKVMTRLPRGSSATDFFGTSWLEMVGYGGDGWLESLGGSIAGTPNCVSHVGGEISCFARGASGSLQQKQWTGTRWAAWRTVGGTMIGNASCVSWGPERIDCFYRGTDNTLKHIWSNTGGDSFGGPESLGGGVASSPSCVSWGSGRLDCFVRGTDNGLYHKWFQGGWGGFTALAGQTFVGAPSCTSWSSNRLDCFVVSSDRRMRHVWWNGTGWYGWEDLGGSLYSSPECLSHSPNNIDCFALGAGSSTSSRTLQHRRFNGSWIGWTNRGGSLASLPSCTSWAADRIDCFGRDLADTLQHTWWAEGLNWSPWEFLNEGIAGDPECISWGSGRLDCFGRGPLNSLRHTFYWQGWFDGKPAVRRLRAWAQLSTAPCCGDVNKFHVLGWQGAVSRGGDSGGPLIKTDSTGQRWTVGVNQGNDGATLTRYIGTFTTGDLGTGNNSGSMRAWLEAALPSSQTGTPP